MFISQNMILIEGATTYERILTDLREVETEEGIRHIQDFLKIYPEFARAHNDLAVMFYQAGNSLKALAHYEKAHKLDPGNVTYRKNLADFYFVELEWTGDAIHTYLDILKDNPFDIEALNALGTISLQIGRKEQARQYFSRTLQLESNNNNARQGLQQLMLPPANITADVKQAPQVASQVSSAVLPSPAAPAIPSFQDLFQASQPEPVRSPDELYNEAITFANADKPNEAIPLLEALVVQDSTNAVAHNDLGVLYQKVGERQKSRHHHEEAVRLQPANRTFQKNLADLLYIEFYEFEKALDIYVRLQASVPQDIEILKAIASVCQTVGNQSDARYFFERVLALQPWDRDAQTAIKEMEAAGKAVN